MSFLWQILHEYLSQAWLKSQTCGCRQLLPSLTRCAHVVLRGRRGALWSNGYMHEVCAASPLRCLTCVFAERIVVCLKEFAVQVCAKICMQALRPYRQAATKKLHFALGYLVSHKNILYKNHQILATPNSRNSSGPGKTNIALRSPHTFAFLFDYRVFVAQFANPIVRVEFLRCHGTVYSKNVVYNVYTLLTYVNKTQSKKTVST